VQTPNGLIFMPMNPPPGFGHFPRPDQEPQFHFHQQQHLQHQQHLQMQHQMFLHQQMMQRQHHQQHQHAGHPFEPSPHQSEQNAGEPSSSDPRRLEQHQQHGLQEQQGSKERPRSQEVQAIENQINKLLNSGGPSTGTTPASSILGGQVLTVQEIEQAQTGELVGQFRRFSLDSPVTPPSARTSAAPGSQKANRESLTPSSSTSQQRSSFFDRRFQDPSIQGEQPKFQASTTRSRFSVKDIDFYADKKYDPYRPSFHTFEQISRDAERLCQDLHPKPEEETRKIALLQKYEPVVIGV